MANSKNIKESDALINILPEYRIRTMKDDLASLPPAPPKELPIVPSIIPRPLKSIPVPRPPEIERAPLPSIEKLISKKLPEPPKPPATPEPEKIAGPRPVSLGLKTPKPKKPKSKKGLVYILIAIIILAGIGGFFYWQGTKPEPKPQPPPEQPRPSESLIEVDETKILSLSNEITFVELIKQEMEKSQTVETFKRIAILKDPSANGQAEFLPLNEVLKELNIKIPPYALAELKDNYTLIIYSQDGKRRLGLIIETKNADNLKEQLTFWEQTMVSDLKNFYLTETPGEPATSDFQDNIYPPISPIGKQANIRYINFPEPGLTIDYTIMENLFILMTSKESMYKAIDRIVEKL